MVDLWVRFVFHTNGSSIFEEISELYFFPSGRWDIKSKKGILIKLPETNLLKALNLAHQITINEIFKNDKVIDLRIYKFLVKLDISLFIDSNFLLSGSLTF